MTVKEIKEHLFKIDNIINSLGYDDFSEDEIGLGRIIEVDSNGGFEGGGDHMDKVFHFQEHDVFLRISGYYCSHGGSEWSDELEHVIPEQVMITKYKTVK